MITFNNLEEIREHIRNGGGIDDKGLYYSEHGWSCGDGCCQEFWGEDHNKHMSREEFIDHVVDYLRFMNECTNYIHCIGYEE